MIFEFFKIEGSMEVRLASVCGFHASSLVWHYSKEEDSKAYFVPQDLKYYNNQLPTDKSTKATSVLIVNQLAKGSKPTTSEERS